MSAVAADTHVILWHLFEPGRLTPAADAALNAAKQAGSAIVRSTISVVEVRYLAEKGRIPSNYLTDLISAVTDSASSIVATPVTLDVARATEHIPRAIVPELPDRIIAATALVLGVPPVTADLRLRACPVPTVW